MANAIIKALIKLVKKFVGLLLVPINVIITNALPDINGVLSYVYNFFNTCFGFVGFVIDSLCIPQPVIAFCVGTLIFKTTISLSTFTVKLAVKWYHALMP